MKYLVHWKGFTAENTMWEKKVLKLYLNRVEGGKFYLFSFSFIFLSLDLELGVSVISYITVTTVTQ